MSRLESDGGRAAWRRTAPSSMLRWRLLAIIVAIAILPQVLTDSYWRINLIVCALNAMLAIALDFILGYAGQLNLGQSAFYGIGAYVSTLLIIRLGVPFWPAFACGVALAGISGMLLSAFAVRLRGHYLAIASLGFAVITYQILLNWENVTQGVRGIYGILPPVATTTSLFYLVAGIALGVYFLLDNLVRSPIGDTLRAIREDEG